MLRLMILMEFLFQRNVELGSHELYSICNIPAYVVYSKVKFFRKCPSPPTHPLSLPFNFPKEQKDLGLNSGEA